MNTSLPKKIEKWPEFVAACQSQWEYGGTRYALAEGKEFTDLVCEAAGNAWIGGTIIKYAGEIINLRKAGEPVPEVGFFKIAVYAFIWWLKEQESLTQRDKGEEFTADVPTPRHSEALLDGLTALVHDEIEMRPHRGALT